MLFRSEKESMALVSCDFDDTKINGFKVKPKNNIEYEGIEVSTLTVVEPNLISNVLRRKTKRKLNAYLQFLVDSFDDDTSSGDLALVLDDVKRYRAIIINKYSKFLDVKFIKELLLRVTFIEEELKMRMHEYNKSLSSYMGKGR